MEVLISLSKNMFVNNRGSWSLTLLKADKAFRTISLLVAVVRLGVVVEPRYTKSWHNLKNNSSVTNRG